MDKEAEKKVEEKLIESVGEEIKPNLITENLQSQIFVDSDVWKEEKRGRSSVKAKSEKPLPQLSGTTQKNVKELTDNQKTGSSTSSHGSPNIQISSSKMVPATPLSIIKPPPVKPTILKPPTVRFVATKVLETKPAESVIKTTKVTTVVPGSGTAIPPIPSTFTGDDEDDYFHGFIFYFSLLILILNFTTLTYVEEYPCIRFRTTTYLITSVTIHANYITYTILQLTFALYSKYFFIDFYRVKMQICSAYLTVIFCYELLKFLLVMIVR